MQYFIFSNCESCNVMSNLSTWLEIKRKYGSCVRKQKTVERVSIVHTRGSVFGHSRIAWQPGLTSRHSQFL